MSNKIILVTDPDDVVVDGFRILAVDLDSDQQSRLSAELKSLATNCSIIVYLWKSSDPIRWLLDKKSKSSLTVFNAEMPNQILAGFLAGFPGSYYYGMLRDLDIYNVNNLSLADNFNQLLERKLEIYERKS